MRLFLMLVLLQTWAAPPGWADLSFLPNTVFAARDSLLIQPDASTDATDCLEGLRWDPADFEVRCQPARPYPGDALVTFPSAIPSGDAVNDRVSMEWYVARDEHGQALSRPAVVVVHESGSNMSVGHLFAQCFQAAGVHAFMIHLPYYGPRRPADQPLDKMKIVEAMRQAIADVRRARDAVAALPYVEGSRISLQGTSLGGFVAATSASLDGGQGETGYDNVFLMLAGGNLLDVIQNGKKDAAKFRVRLEQAGLTIKDIEALVYRIEPTRIAHRMNRQRTWLYSAQYDQVVEMKNAQALADRIRLDPDHHVRLLANHYSGAIYVPLVLASMMAAIEK